MMKRIYLMALIVLMSGLTISAQTGTWSGELKVQGSRLPLVFHLADDKPTMDSPDQGVRGIEISLKRNGPNMISIQIPPLGASYEGVWMGKNIVGTFKQMSMSLPLTLSPGENKPSRPQTPVGPFPYSTEELTFNSGDIVLKGTLVMPEACSYDTPALIMVTGSGLQNRDEEIFDHKPFAVIADALARQGIASLRYDDRGYGDSSANTLAWTIDDFKSDAQAAINLLRERFGRVGVLGHSEGGTIALMLATEKKADFIISLAGMVVSGAETLLYQNRIMLLGAGVPEDAVDTYCRLLKEAFDATINDRPMPDIDVYDLPDALKQNMRAAFHQIQTPYMRHFLSQDVRPQLSKISCPVLALNGTKDQQVECDNNLNALADGLSDGVRLTAKSIEGANHLLQECHSGSVSEYRSIEETISQEVLDHICSWIQDF